MLDVIWTTGTDSRPFETWYSCRSCREISKTLISSGHTIGAWIDLQAGDNQAGGAQAVDLLARISTPTSGDLSRYILIVTSPETIISAHAVHSMMTSLEEGGILCMPVYNETDSTGQLASMPYQYLNVSTYEEVSEIVSKRPGNVAAGHTIFRDQSAQPDLSCVLLHKVRYGSVYTAHGSLRLPLHELLAAVGSDGVVLDRNALVHRFGNYYSGERDEMVDRVPETAISILDLGAARGGFGRTLKRERPEVHLTGVEKDPVLAREAAPYYDELIVGDAESANIHCRIDHVNCGEVIEHVYNPWTLMDCISQMLVEGGTLCLSLPNAGHWTVVRELSQGRFVYTTIGVQCVGHIRWFTESSICDLLANTGFTIDDIVRMEIPPTPEGNRFIQHICEQGHGNRKSLLTFNMIIRARKKQATPLCEGSTEYGNG